MVRQGFVAALVGALALGAVAAGSAAGAIGGPTEIVSVGPAGSTPVTDRDFGSISADGSLIALSSAGRDLDPQDPTPFVDVFTVLRGTRAFTRASVAADGGGSSDDSVLGSQALSADGTLVAFSSRASNLVDHDANGRSDVFVRNRSTGVTERISSNYAGLDANGSSTDAAISADGRYVAFASTATDLLAPGVPSLTGRTDVYVRDRQTGTTRLVSAAAPGVGGNGSSSEPAVSGDGKVVFLSEASDLVAGDTNGRADVFLADLTSGSIRRVNVSRDGAQANGTSYDPAISADGSAVAFASVAGNLGGNRFRGADVFVRDLTTDRLERVVAPDGMDPFTGVSLRPALSADARYVAFDNDASWFTPDEGNERHVIVLDRATDRFVSVSRAYTGSRQNGSSTGPVLAGDGSLVGWRSTSTNLVADFPDMYNHQVFVRPLTPDAVPDDGDGVAAIHDTCPHVADPAQSDFDGDGRGDACEWDSDSDIAADAWEPGQGTHVLNRDTDGDGLDDWNDDYPTDKDKGISDEHKTVNVAEVTVPDHGKITAELTWDATTKQSFRVAVAGTLQANRTYDVVVFRRAPFLQETRLCRVRASAQGALGCTPTSSLRFFTHVAVRHGGDVIGQAPVKRVG